MNGRIVAGVAAVALSMMFTATPAFVQTQAPAGAPQPPAAGPQSPAAGAPGRTGGAGGAAARNAAFTEAMQEALNAVNNAAGLAISQNGNGQVCFGSPMCAWGTGRNLIAHELRTTDMGYTYEYPLTLPAAVPWAPVNAVALNSKGHIFAFMRQASGSGAPQLAEWDENHKFVKAWGVGLAVKAHGMAIDAHDNIWVCDQFGPTVMEFSPEGTLLKTIGVKGKSGVWDEAKELRLLWQPLDLAFAPNGDIYIGEGHANESPNDGAARVIHLDKNGTFINQWFGNAAGQGHFSMVHGIAVNPDNGNVYLGDREEYRIVVYDGNGKFIKTIQMRNLVCALYVDPHKQLWLATGQDGQIFKIDWDGKVLGVAGNGPGRGPGQFAESTYMGMDPHGNLFVGDTSVGRVTAVMSR
jgi:DNA-binding beta-propeller fold protein YncE